MPDDAIAGEIRTTRDRQRLERLADETAAPDSARASALLERLLDSFVRDDADTETAGCDALVRQGLMVKHGNLNYRRALAHGSGRDALRAAALTD
jgi:hypothetical protein